MHTPRLPQRATAGSGQVLIRADLDDRVSGLGWRPNWPPICLACRNITSGTFSRAMPTPEMSLGSSNAKGSCHCNPRCTFPFLALQDTRQALVTARIFSPSEGSPITAQLRSCPGFSIPNMATKDKRREKWIQTDRVYRLFPPAPKHQNIVLHLALRSCFYWSRGTATETVASPPQAQTIHD